MTAKLSERRPIVRLALSRTEVALSIGVSVSSVDQMVAEGALPLPRLWHSRKLWLVSEVEACLNDWPTEEATADDNLAAWIAARDRQESDVAPVPDWKDDALQKYYDQLGFDPQTMDGSDFTRLYGEAEDRWRESIPGTPLNKREQKVLLQFEKHGPGILVPHHEIKGTGIDTEERLVARGFIELKQQEKFPDRLAGYILTASGFKKMMSLRLGKSG